MRRQRFGADAEIMVRGGFNAEHTLIELGNVQIDLDDAAF